MLTIRVVSVLNFYQNLFYSLKASFKSSQHAVKFKKGNILHQTLGKS